MASRSTKPTPKSIEKKFAETAFRLIQERNDFFLPQIRDFVLQKRWLNLRPEYQRRLVWDDQKRSLFIESMLLNVPIPPVFLYEWDLSRYEVMDGQQRLNCIVDFFDNGFALKGLERWHELNGLQYRDLPDVLKRGLDRRRISATVLLVGSGEKSGPEQSDVRKLVFERLNTGGQQLNAQELRNCLYAGPFNDLLIDLSHVRQFTDAWEIPPYEENLDSKGNISEDLRNNPRYRRMQDCEIVLRFFAFRKKSNIKGSVRAMLDRCMIEHLSATEKAIAALSEQYVERLLLSKRIFEKNVFRYQDEDDKWQLSVPLYDGIMVALDRLWESRKQLIVNRAAIVQKVSHLLKSEKNFEVIVGRPNTAKAVQMRMDVLTKAIGSVI
jgi:hypothetical protein